MAIKQEMFYVYEAPVRLWHWVTAIAITVLAITGYLIGSPPPSMSGEASDHFLMGYIRFAHFTSGYIVAIGLVLRAYWACVGNRYSRELFMPAVWRASYWKEFLFELRWYLFLEKEPKKYMGHNPMADFFMFTMFLLGTIFMVVTGFALYGEGTGEGSWAHSCFTTWVIPLFGQSQDVHTWHHLGMWYIVIFIMMHLYAAVREDIMSRQSLISSMVSGWRRFKDERS
jgi:Ni/Fe-hydrogenase 1 B-type cytochrome subunit